MARSADEEREEAAAAQNERMKPARSAWSDEPPTEPGWYYWRSKPENTWTLLDMWIKNGIPAVRYCEAVRSCAGLCGQWQPVQEPRP